MDKPIKFDKPHAIISRIYGVLSSSQSGDEFYSYFRTKFGPYILANWEDATMQEIVKNLREQVSKDAIADLPQIAPETAKNEEVVNSIIAFLDKRTELAKNNQKTGARLYPSIISLKSFIIGMGLAKGDLVAALYDDVPPALEKWVNTDKLKFYTLSSGPVDGQLAYFAHTNKGDLGKFITNGLSSTHPAIAAKDSEDSIDFRVLVSKLIEDEAENVMLLTDKGNLFAKVFNMIDNYLFYFEEKEARSATKAGLKVVIVSRENKLGHITLTKDLLEDLTDFSVTSSLANIQFNEPTP